MTPNQQINIPKLLQGTPFVPVGKNAAGVKDLNVFVLSKTPFTEKYVVNYVHYQ